MAKNGEEMSEKSSTFLLDQLGRAPLYALLIVALWYIHQENKTTQAHLVTVLETTLRDNTGAMNSVKSSLEMQSKSSDELSRELSLHRQVMRDKMTFDKTR